MDLKNQILAKIREKNTVQTAEIVKETGLSRTYVSQALRELVEEGEIVNIGKTNKSMYILANKEALAQAKGHVLLFHHIYSTKGLAEDQVLAEIKRETGIFTDLPENTAGIVDFAFLEMVNNAIEHSQSTKIIIKMLKSDQEIVFIVADKGVGIFNKIKNVKKLPNIETAVQELIKGKQTTDPKAHTGQGIFFTSKMARIMNISSFGKVITFNNEIEDIFLADTSKKVQGTKVMFRVATNTKQSAKAVFDKYTDPETFSFTKTRVAVKLFKLGEGFISRSEARRIMFGLEHFAEIMLDFKGVNTVGQGFADEVFRVWQNLHPEKKIAYVNANENVEFMIKHSLV